ncbi:MAG: N-formylglutamate deformylase [Gammaproteobacteria bacterium]|nr:N-formylglutamate deformylase [Gammaproteobacteria bacterium]
MKERRHPADTHSLAPGGSPLVISMPHSGTTLPAYLAPQLTPLARTLPDTDWHVPELYEFAAALGATLIIARYTRYQIDLNRPPDDAALYATGPATGLCPVQTFAGEALYADGRIAIDAAEVTRRRAQYWQPYHDELRRRLALVRERHGYAVLLDAHSIRSEVPRLFANRLPDINLGTYGARSCSPEVSAAVRAQLERATGFSHVVDGRFKGGYITRHYGNPEQRVHALQIELAQSCYMDEAGTAYDPQRAAPLRETLRGIVEALLQLPLARA